MEAALSKSSHYLSLKILLAVEVDQAVRTKEAAIGPNVLLKWQGVDAIVA